MKKKIFALLLVVLMLVPFIVACGGNDTNTDTNTNTNTNTGNTETTDTSKPSDTGSGTPTVEKVDTKTDKSQKWNGKTLDVLASGWGQDAPGEDPTNGGYNTHAWSQPELYVREQNAMTDIKKIMKIFSVSFDNLRI